MFRYQQSHVWGFDTAQISGGAIGLAVPQATRRLALREWLLERVALRVRVGVAVLLRVRLIVGLAENTLRDRDLEICVPVRVELGVPENGVVTCRMASPGLSPRPRPAK